MAASPRPPLGDESDLHHKHNNRLRATVANRVRLPADLVDDACQHAFLRAAARSA